MFPLQSQDDTVPCELNTACETEAETRPDLPPISSSQTSRPPLGCHISWPFTVVVSAFIWSADFPAQPLTQWHCTSINRSWQWHVEFFITSPQGEPSCLCLCIFLSHPCLSLSVCLSHALIPSALWVGRGGELCFCCLLFGQMRGAAAVAVSDWSPLHGLSSPRLWLLHCGYHPTQDRPPQPGCASLLPMGEEGTLWFCVCLGGLSVHVMDF